MVLDIAAGMEANVGPTCEEVNVGEARCRCGEGKGEQMQGWDSSKNEG